jgi:type III restriction enzyme
MITVANRTETAARIKYAFDHKRVRIDELCIPELILHIDSKVLDMTESQEEPVSAVENAAVPEEESEEEIVHKLTKKEQAELLRRTVDTVGKMGEPGERIQKVISVGMLSEGWDAKTVTHIMGLRAFSSQLLCEQVVGRGLRRTSYEVNTTTGLFEAEYVNIFGVPFTFLLHESTDGPPPPPPPPKREVKPVSEKKEFEISWPNVIRIDHSYKPVLELDVSAVKTLTLNAYDTATLAELAPIVEGKPDISKISAIDLEGLGKKFRMQKIIFETARDVFDQMKPSWKGNKEYLLAQVIRLVERIITSDVIQIEPPLFFSG